MDDINKLHHLLEHWAEHNIDHAKSYADWAEKARALGKGELYGVLKEIAEETQKMDLLFRRAADLCR